VSRNAALQARFRLVPVSVAAEVQLRPRRARLVRFPVRLRCGSRVTISAMPARPAETRTVESDEAVAALAGGGTPHE
jgi:hypothetical protein